MLASVLGSSSLSFLGFYRSSGSALRSLPPRSWTTGARCFHALPSPFPRRQMSHRPLANPTATEIRRNFHATSRNGLSFAPFIWVFKSSTALSIAETLFRITLTFVPLTTLTRIRSQKVLERIDKLGVKNRLNARAFDSHRTRALVMLRRGKSASRILLWAPAMVVVFTLLAGIERAPLTGRWRLILLSPPEEEDIARQLAGAGWYDAVGEILTADGAQPKLIDASDWRYRWVQMTLRRLESVIPILQAEKELLPDWTDDARDIPIPPPAEFPLRPRPRASDYFRRVAEIASMQSTPATEHSIPGPPYSLLVVENPDALNAFSYGFGSDGAAGIVVYSGFLDDIMSKHPPENTVTDEVSWWSSIFGNLFSVNPSPSSPVPTPEQTSELAILLAHEVSHLILSHHIETLSAGSIVGPRIVGIVTDVVRTITFPFTMLFGPFLNDALAGVWKASSVEFVKYSGMCTSHVQEIEADIVSARLLAHAGFDPRHAVRFWENRQEATQSNECAHAPVDEAIEPVARRLSRQWSGSSHPLTMDRVEKLRQELKRWEEAKRRALEARASPQLEWRREWGLVL